MKAMFSCEHYFYISIFNFFVDSIFSTNDDKNFGF